MDFVKLSTNKISTFNVDYDIELLWYGFKNLISNYFSHLKKFNVLLMLLFNFRFQ